MTVRDGFTGIELSAEESRLARDRLRFLELVAEGTPESLAGEEIGWSWFKVKSELSKPEFFEAVQAAIHRADDSVVEALYKQARRGNMTAIQMVLFNRRPSEWRDVRRIEVVHEATVHVEMVDAVKRSAIELLREHGVGAMRELSRISVIEAEAVDADGSDA